MQGQNLPEKFEFIFVPVCHRLLSCPIRDLQGFALCKYDRKTLPSYSISALYVSEIECYFSIILIDFFNLIDKELKFRSFQRSVVRTSDQFYCYTSKANYSTRIVHLLVYRFSQRYKSNVYTVCLLINKQSNLN